MRLLAHFPEISQFVEKLTQKAAVLTRIRQPDLYIQFLLILVIIHSFVKELVNLF